MTMKALLIHGPMADADLGWLMRAVEMMAKRVGGPEGKYTVSMIDPAIKTEDAARLAIEQLFPDAMAQTEVKDATHSEEELARHAVAIETAAHNRSLASVLHLKCDHLIEKNGSVADAIAAPGIAMPYELARKVAHLSALSARLLESYAGVTLGDDEDDDEPAPAEEAAL